MPTTPSAGDSVYRKFTTRDPSTGIPAALASGTISIYKDASTTESTTGVTLTASFDSVTGLNHVSIDTSADTTFYVNGSRYYLTLTAGTVAGSSVIGEVVGEFDLGSSIINAVRTGLAQAGNATSITLDASASATTDLYKGEQVWLTSGTGAGQVRTIIGYNGSTKVATVDRNWTTNPGSASVFAVLAVDSASINSNLAVTTGNATVVIRSGTAQTGSTTNTIKLDSGASATNNIYVGDLVAITSGTGLGQSRIIVSYVGSTKVATVDRNWTTTPDNTSAFQISASTTASAFSDQGVAQAGAATTITLQSTASATSSIYIGSLVTTLSGTGSGQTREITAYNGGTKVATVDSAWSTNPDSTTGYAVIPTVSGTGVPSGTQDVNVLTWASTAVSVDSNSLPKVDLASTGLDAVVTAEPSAVPAFGTGTIVQAIAWLLALGRNKITQTSTTQTLRNNADAASIATSTVSDDGTTFTRGKFT